MHHYPSTGVKAASVQERSFQIQPRQQSENLGNEVPTTLPISHIYSRRRREPLIWDLLITLIAFSVNDGVTL